MSLSSTSLPKPKNWQDFESHMRVLMACTLGDKETQANGRSGQSQAGIDVYGYRGRDLAKLVGVQCKKKFDKPVTAAELRTEVQKTKKFKPSRPTEFILATTAPRDQAIQAVARTVTQELDSAGERMTVAVWGWEDIEERAAEHEDAWNAFDPTFTPYAKRAYEKISAEIQQAVDQLGSKIEAAALHPANVTVDAGGENTPLHGQITAYSVLIDEGHIQAALAQLEKIRTNDWAKASRSERYRLLVSIASAKLKEDDYAAAGRYLLDAFAECPEHKRARENRAKGYLLTDEYVRAREIALEILTSEPQNSDAASTLIQARLGDPACATPLADIPPELLESEDVFIARVHFLRCRGDLAWLPAARDGADKHPKSRLLCVMAAEAVLEELTRSDRDVMAGAPVKAVSQKELEEAVEVLRSEAQASISKGFRIAPSLANNAALALRFVDDVPAAIAILDAAVTQHSGDENLRFQRAILAFAQNDLRKVLELIPENTSNPEAVPMRATALADTGKPEEALKLIDGFDASAAPDYVKLGVLSARCHAYLVRNDKELAIETARKEALAAPGDAHVAAVLIRTYYLGGDSEAASKTLEEVAARFGGMESMSSRMLLSFEAQRLDRNDIIVDLLKGRVATDYENEALRLLIAAAVNGHFWVIAQETLDSIAQGLQGERWVQRARAILAINTGSRDIEQRIGAYLKKWPNDASMILMRVGAWQRAGRDKDVTALVSSMNWDALEGSVESRIRLAAVACRYGAGERALPYAYSALMDNWDTPRAHLAYSGVILLNEQIAAVLPPSDAVAENTVVHLVGEGGDRWYRLEKRSHKFFEDERLELGSDLAQLLLGKKVGDSFVLQERVGAKPVAITEIKPIYIHAFHRSMDQFNERFPRAQGMMKLSFDATADDPLEEMRAITRARAESDQTLLEYYEAKRVPLAFVAGVMGRDPLDAWAGLPSVDVRFQVCHGAHQEREEAVQLLARRERKGCVLDAITLSVVRRLGIGDAVVYACGPLHAPQSVLDRFAARAIEAKANIGSKMGFISWREGQLVMQDYTEEMLRSAAAESEADKTWANANVAVVSAMPKLEFSRETHAIVEMAGNLACDPVVAADGNGLLLLSDDFGLRQWSNAAFRATATWLQPVLMLARQEGAISEERYFAAINALALSGYVYTSLEAGALLQQARKDGFEVSDNLRRLLDAVGGPTADLKSNCRVMAGFLNLVMQEYSDDFKVLRIASQVFASMVRDRFAEQRPIVAEIVQQVTAKRKWIQEHALGWLVGHSIGMPDFDELATLYRSAVAAREPA